MCGAKLLRLAVADTVSGLVRGGVLRPSGPLVLQ